MEFKKGDRVKICDEDATIVRREILSDGSESSCYWQVLMDRKHSNGMDFYIVHHESFING